jgi:CelD/BcsL family acetyltransferase involved in cellulose biosynthesis
MEYEICTDLESLEPILDAWDKLAIGRSIPMSAPAWMLGWWRHMRPDRARLRVVIVRDAGELIGIAPFFVVPPRTRAGRVDYRLLGSGNSEGLTPLAVTGREWDVARLFALALADGDPRPDLITFEATPMGAIWPSLLRERWQGALRPAPLRPTVSTAAVISLRFDSFDAWLASLDKKLRAEAKRRRRRLEEAGGAVRWSTRATLRADLETVLRLHTMRWDGRGESALVPLRDRTIACFEEIGETLLDDGRLRVQLIEVDGEAISAHIIMACGGRILSLNGGWDERYKALSPPMLRVLATVEDGISRGDRELSLGNGTQPYKLRFADAAEPLIWGELLTPGPRLPLTRIRRAPHQAREALRVTAKRTLAPGQADRLRGALRRLRR